MFIQRPFVPGQPVWVVERNEDGCSINVAGYMFLASTANVVILTPFVMGLETLDEILDYHIQETAENYDTDLVVFPQNDCYHTREGAEAARGEEDARWSI